jgi:hypothetical protein
VFVPEGTRGHNLRLSDLRETLEGQLDFVGKEVKNRGGSALMQHLDESAQPVLATRLMNSLLGLCESLPESDRPGPEQMLMLSAILMAVVEELHWAQD